MWHIRRQFVFLARIFRFARFLVHLFCRRCVSDASIQYVCLHAHSSRTHSKAHTAAAAAVAIAIAIARRVRDVPFANRFVSVVVGFVVCVSVCCLMHRIKQLKYELFVVAFYFI